MQSGAGAVHTGMLVTLLTMRHYCIACNMHVVNTATSYSSNYSCMLPMRLHECLTVSQQAGAELTHALRPNVNLLSLP